MTLGRSTQSHVAEAMTRLVCSLDEGVLRAPRPDLAPLVNWRGGGGLPIHRWHRYREGFSPALIAEFGLGPRILDPFCGSGSIMVGAAQRGRAATGIDVNPLAAFVARVELTPLDEREVEVAASFLASFEREMEHVGEWPTPALRITAKVFEPDVLHGVLQLRALIERRGDDRPRVRDFLLLAWLSMLQDVGSYFKEGNGIKYRNRQRLKAGYVVRPDGVWQRQRFGADQRAFVSTAYRGKLAEMLADLPAWRCGDWTSQLVVEGNSLEEAEHLDGDSFDSVIYS